MYFNLKTEINKLDKNSRQPLNMELKTTRTACYKQKKSHLVNFTILDYVHAIKENSSPVKSCFWRCLYKIKCHTF